MRITRALVAVAVAAPGVVMSSTGPAAAADPPPSISLDVTVRDFDHCPADGNAPACHPDFEHSDGSDKGIVAQQLGADGTPVYANPGATTPTTTGQANFDQWYHDVPGVNVAVPTTLVADLVVGSDPPTYRYALLSYFPVDGKGWNDPSFGNPGQVDGGHNFSFTTELHSRFTYQGGERFFFAGDDDLWVFIDGELVIDLGGVHPIEVGSVALDEVAAGLGLVVGESYSFDMFGAERHTTESNFAFQTSILLVQPTVDVTGVTDGASYELGAVPVAGCEATDELGDPVLPPPTPSVGPVTGELAAHGLGRQAVTCTYAGETATATYSIVTTQPPVLGAHDDVLVEIPPDQTGAVVDYALPPATDPHGLPVTVTCDPPPGSTFAVGATAVQCGAVNVAGLSAVTPVTFTVTVRLLPKADTVLVLLPMQRGALRARLTTADGDPVAGAPIVFADRRGIVCTAVTDADGVATCPGVGGVGMTLSGYSASYAGDALHHPASTGGGLGGGPPSSPS